MKKLKKLELITISSDRQKKILGGTICDYYSTNLSAVSCDYYESNITTAACKDIGASNVGGGYGGGGTSTVECIPSCMCMPGDNADYGSFLGWSITNNYMGGL